MMGLSPPGKEEGGPALPLGSPPTDKQVSDRYPFRSTITPASDNEKQRAADLAEAADIALDTGRWVVVAGMVLIPDTLAVELMANNPGEPWPKTWQLARDDGRVVHAFRAPAGWS